MDPYVYSNTNVLINKLNIKDEKELIDVEAQLIIAGILDITSISTEINFQEYRSLQNIHHFLFHELYSWAGEFRTINIYKTERVLNGLSVDYSNEDQITSDLKEIFSWANSKQWNYSNPQLAEDFSTLMTNLWRVHPYREGNTRTLSIFMKLFAEANSLAFNAQLLSQHAGYLRNALVLAAVEEASEPQYLLKMITDALNLDTLNMVQLGNEESSNYQVIGQYDVSKYEEKPFKTDFDPK
jgi:cell filamentation protein